MHADGGREHVATLPAVVATPFAETYATRAGCAGKLEDVPTATSSSSSSIILRLLFKEATTGSPDSATACAVAT